MTLKKFLFLPLLISLIFFVYFSGTVAESIQILREQLNATPGLILAMLFATALQIMGHLVRARKAEYLFRPIKDNTTRFQFRALSIGYLFNALLPFKLGELVRARIISAGLELSFSLALTLILFERALDAIVLGTTGLALLLLLGALTQKLLIYILLMLVIALLILLAVSSLIKQNKHLLLITKNTSSLFKDNIKHSFRFKVWSVIYGTQHTLQKRRLGKYVMYTILSWIFYFGSLFVVVKYFFGNLGALDKMLASTSPYFGISLPAGPANLGVFSKITNAFNSSIGLSMNNELVYNLVCWAVLIIPISAIGFILLFVKTKETLWRNAPKLASARALENKLSRTEDISQEMASFLDNFFSGNKLSHIVHQLELKENIKLLQYFKGGSDAITILVKQKKRIIVKKIIAQEFEGRLMAQHDWLRSKNSYKGIVRALRQNKQNEYYSIDLEYDPDNEMLFDYMHKNPVSFSEKIFDQSWKYLKNSVYAKTSEPVLHNKNREQYVATHIFGCLEKAANVDINLLRAAVPKKLIINGSTYDNLYQIINKIKKHPKAWHDIAYYSESEEVHGDFAVDNILVSSRTGDALLIDPAPDGNIINGPVFDFGKNMQSLYCGYEFLLRDEDPVLLTNGNVINFREYSSAQYEKLCRYVRHELAPTMLSDTEQRAMLFHAGALHIRRLKHQVYYNPANVLKFYAVGVKTLNDFLAQYD